MKKNLFLSAIMFLAVTTFIACDKSETEPNGVPENINVECIAQFENTMLGYIDVEATWTDARGRLHHAYPSPHYLEHGNRQVSRITVDTTYHTLPASTDITLTYTAKQGIIQEDGFVDIPTEGIDVIIYTGINVSNNYAGGKETKHTYDIASFIRQSVKQDEFIDLLEELNTSYGRIYVSVNDSGSISTAEDTGDEGNDGDKNSGNNSGSTRPGRS